jgi:hypothetical protein
VVQQQQQQQQGGGRDALIGGDTSGKWKARGTPSPLLAFVNCD